MLRPTGRRWEPDDLEGAKKVVSRAERDALDRAEQLRREAEQLLKAAGAQVVDAELKVREEFSAEMDALRAEMAAAGLRATAAEGELELLRAEHTELRAWLEAAGIGTAGGPASSRSSGPRPAEGAPPGLRLVTASSEPDAVGGPPAPATTSAHSGSSRQSASQAPADGAPEAGDRRRPDPAQQAGARAGSAARGSEDKASGRPAGAGEHELAQAREEAVRLLAAAGHEAEELLAAAVDAVEHDSGAARAALERAEAERQSAANLRVEAERVLERAEQEAARLVATARQDGADILANAREERELILADARQQRELIVGEARGQAREEAEYTRRRLAAEIATLRGVMDRLRDSMDQFLEVELIDS